ncbi:MAG: hypothetical protein AABM30_08770 [Actinomycetota bacterium]
MTEAGVDTWRLLFRTTLDSPPDYPLFDVGRYKAQWFAGHSVLALEGHPSREGLAEPWALEDAYQDAVEDLRQWGHVPTAFAGVARLDSTVTQRMSRHEGQAVLAGLAALDVPACDPVVRGKPAHSIAYVHTRGRRVLGRAYDKGRESGTAEAWELIRFEDQFRAASGKRPGRENFHAEYVRGRFHKRFVPMYRSARGVKVTGLPVIAKDVAGRVHSGELDTRRAERMMGSLLLLTAGAPYSRSTYYKRRAELRENGYVIADDFFTSVEVDLASVLEAALETPLWGSNG